MVALALAAVIANATSGLDAAARAEGNRKTEAIAVGRSLFATLWPAQVLKIRIDGAGRHSVAGLMLSGVKFHRRLDASSFTAEVIALVRTTFAASDVEEVDVWATVPLPKFDQKPVNGEYLQPTDRIVYGATILRSEEKTFPVRLNRGDDVFWDPGWKRSL
jgi:hypothetical protein